MNTRHTSINRAERFTMRLLLCLFFFIFIPAPAFPGESGLVMVETRPGVTVQVYLKKRSNARATLALLPGGSGEISMKHGLPAANDFLIKSRDYFSANGFNVAIIGPPSDMNKLEFDFRIGPEHIEDIRRVVAYLKKDSTLPVWLVGTSRGTLSAASAAIAFGNQELAGIVLTASITSSNGKYVVPALRLDEIRIPVFVLHHKEDACSICKPDDAALILQGLTNAPIKKLLLVKGGGPPSEDGDECNARHWHGFIGMEKEAADIISSWIDNPTRAGGSKLNPYILH